MKIRGHRIELAEIETTLRTHPAVIDTTVQAHHHPTTNTTRLTAYLVLDGELDQQDITEHLRDRLPSEEAASRPAEVRVLVGQLLDSLPEREAEILRLRFYDELTQTEIADRIGISQMHVSRLIRRCLLDLRETLDR